MNLDLSKYLLHIHQFKNASGRIRVTDPCYDRQDLRLCVVMNDVLPGTWNAYVLRSDERAWGYRVARSYIVHESIDLAKAVNSKGWRGARTASGSSTICVDAGIAGFFNEDTYLGREGDRRDERNRNSEKWYNDILDKLYSEESGRSEDERLCSRMGIRIMKPDFCPAAKLDDGVVTQTGYGDGGYEVKVRTQKGKVVAAYIEYFEPDPQYVIDPKAPWFVYGGGTEGALEAKLFPELATAAAAAKGRLLESVRKHNKGLTK